MNALLMLIQKLKNISIPQRKLVTTLVSIIILTSQNAHAISFLLPENPQDGLIREFAEGANKQIISSKDEDLLDIARRFDLGQNEIIRLNHDVDRWLPGAGTKIQLQSERLLPDAPRTGMVLNLPEFRLYYFPRPQEDKPSVVITHPISIGRQDWETPLGQTRIVQKTENPTWTPPESIKREYEAKGDPLPNVVPAGPNNPLGLFAMRLGIPGYLIHSTNKPYGVGLRVSHGCIRMYPEDISKLFPNIEVGDLVTIVNQAVKTGWSGDDLYIEVHPPLENHRIDNLLDIALDLIELANDGVLPVLDGIALSSALAERQGLPVKIFTQEPPSLQITNADNE